MSLNIKRFNSLMPARLLKIAFVFVLPVTLFVAGVIPVRYRLHALILFSIVTIALVVQEKYALHELGIRTDNMRGAFVPYTLFTLLGVGLILIFAKILGRAPVANWQTDYHFTFLFLPISIIQEFLYRGYLMPTLKRLFSSTAIVILINALLFTLIHAIYPPLAIAIPLAFVAGLGFAVMYHRYPNLILISLSHSVLNFAAVLFGFFYRPIG